MILHVACLPFPTFQGTQAAIDAMLRASAKSGRSVCLLAYAHGAYVPDAPYEIHRIGDFPKVRSLRSGPSIGKVALDARCIFETRRLVRRLQPDAIVAHHIEAAIATLAAGLKPVYYLAHTSLSRELPVYLRPLPRPLVEAAAARSEAWVCRRAQGVAAVAPALTKLVAPRALYVPVPWPRTDAGMASRIARARAREALRLPAESPICLYAGNLDRYQGWESLLAALVALRQTHRRASLLFATESDPSPVRRAADRFALEDAVHVRRLDGEAARAAVHAAADLAWIPRRIEGGLPIKMLDAFSRGLPVVAMRRATAGLPVESACLVTGDDDPLALAEGARGILDDPRQAERLRTRAFRYLDTHHGAGSFLAALDALMGVGPSAQSMQDVPPAPTDLEPRAR